jgi:hypothetical protein
MKDKLTGDVYKFYFIIMFLCIQGGLYLKEMKIQSGWTCSLRRHNKFWKSGKEKEVWVRGCRLWEYD